MRSLEIISVAVTLLGISTASAQESAAPSYRVLGGDRGHVAIVAPGGKVEWETETKTTPHDLALLPNGNLLLPTSDTTIVEMTPEKKVVWSFTSKKTPANKDHVEIHAFQRLDDGNTMIAESGNRRIIEVDPSGKIVKTIPLHVDHPSAHSDTRRVRKLANGHYLVSHESDSTVREYDGEGKVVWSYKLDLAGRPASPGHGLEGHGTSVFAALRLPNGNTLIAAGNGNRVIEVTPEGKVIWSVEHDELPGIRLAWVTSLQVLPSGNLIFGNCHAGPDYPQLIEVSRDKKVVWTFKDFKTFGNSLAAAQVLGVDGVLR